MIKRFLACLSVLGLTLGAALLAAPLFQPPQAPRFGRNPAITRPRRPLQVTKEELAEPIGHALCLAISPDGGTLAAGCTDGFIHLLAPFSGEKSLSLAGAKQGYVRSVAFVPGGNTVAALSDDNQLRLWDTTSGKMLNPRPALGDIERAGLPRLSPSSLAVSPDGSLIAVGGAGTADGSGIIRFDDNTFFEFQVQDLKTGKLKWSRLERRGYMHELVFSPDGKTLASDTSLDVRLWDARTGELKQTLKPKSGNVWSIAFSTDNEHFAGYGTAPVERKNASWLTLWDLRSGAVIHSINAGESPGATAPGTLAFSPDGKTLASAGCGIARGRISIGGKNIGVGEKVVSKIKLWNVATGALNWTSPEGDYGQVTALVFSPDGLSLYCSDSSATSRIDARTGQTRKDLMNATYARPK
jgi:WD40 repeat protein